MNFNSLQFLIFLAAVLLLYWLLPSKCRWALLLVASYYFYMSWNPWLVFLMLGTTLVSYGTALAIQKTEKKAWKRLWMAIALIVCLGALFFFKYFNFLIKSVIDFLNLFALRLDPFALNLILPIGISFYTFQTLSYVIDVYKGKFTAERHLGYYALFVCYFPQLVAGPIERPGDLIPQLKAEHKFDREDFATGFRILLVGFFYKCVVADISGIFANNVFHGTQELNGLAVFLGGLLFTGQMFFDFMGYSEIATGAARMMGVKLTRNFIRPYHAASYSEFFRRWHVTLTRWFTDYVYIPLGGNRKGKVRKILNIAIVFLLCGLWHGANWTYVVWGAYAAVFLALENVLGKPIGNFFSKRGIDFDGDSSRSVRRLLMFLVYIPAGIIFRADSLSHAGSLLWTMFTSWGFNESYFNEALRLVGLDVSTILLVALTILCAVMIYPFGEIGRESKSKPKDTPAQEKAFEIRRLIILVYTIALIALCWLAVVGLENDSAFLYFQF